MIAIHTEELSRIYKSYTKKQGLGGSLRGFFKRNYIEKMALQATTLDIESGQIVGLVGANGAGKTTLLKILSGLIFPTSGKVQVLGFTPFERKPEYLRKMSLLLGQKNQLWWDISPRDSYHLLAEIYGLDRKVSEQKVKDLSELLHCQSVLDTQLRRLSLGERMKMELIGALLHSPEILFLDEPTIGLDIVAQTQIRNFLLEYVKEKKPTIILTSHYMDDIAKLADKLLLMSKGRIVYNGSVREFTKKSKALKIVSFELPEALIESKKILNYELESGKQIFQVSVTEKDLPFFLSHVTLLPGILNLKIEEVDFEDVIRQFLETESSVL